MRCWSHKVDYEESLILLEYHAVLDGLLLVKIVPGTICALFAIASVFQYPVTVLVFDRCLPLWNKLIVYSDVAVWWAPDDQFLFTVLAYAKIKRKKVKYSLSANWFITNAWEIHWIEILTQRLDSQGCRVGISSASVYMEYGHDSYCLTIRLDCLWDMKQHTTRLCSPRSYLG